MSPLEPVAGAAPASPAWKASTFAAMLHRPDGAERETRTPIGTKPYEALNLARLSSFAIPASSFRSFQSQTLHYSVRVLSDLLPLRSLTSYSLGRRYP